MTVSASFAVDVIACAALGILFWAACAGIGFRILPGASTPRTDAEPASWRQPGVAACVGLGALLALGGFAVVLRIPWWVVVVPFGILGLALAVRDLSRTAWDRTTKSALVIGGCGVAALGLVALIQAVVGLRFPLSGCDDWRAYLPMAHRLLDTYGLDEPWSTRRLQSLGGFDLLRALPVAVFGHVGVGVAETVIAGIFFAGLFVANGFRSTWTRLLSVGFILAIPLLWVPRANTTGVLMGTPLLVAVFAATVELRRAVRADQRGASVRWATAAGLVTAALMSIRPNLGLLASLILALGTLSATGARMRVRFRTLLAGGVSAFVAVSPWSFDMWRAAGSPLYPLFTGNLNRAAMAIEAPRDVWHLTELAVNLVMAGPYLWVTLGVLVIAVAVGKLLPDAPVLAIGAIATVMITVVFALNTPFAPVSTFVRYIAPMAGSLAVFLVCEAVRAADVLRPEPARRLATAHVALAVTTAIALTGLCFIDGRVRFGLGNRPGGAELVELAARNELVRPPGQELTTAALRESYRLAFRRADPDRTIVAVDRPFLIDYSRYDVPNLDAPGYMAPGDGFFPFFTGPGPKIARLRRGGFDTLIATDPASDLCLNQARIEKAVQARPSDRPRYSRFLDWDRDLQAIAQQTPHAVRRVGTLLVIDLVQAERELAATATFRD